MKTGDGRGASLSELFSGIFVCLIGDEHRGSLHLVSPISPDESRRFLQSSVDTITLHCPDLGTLTGLLIGPEFGSWFLDRVSVTNMVTGEAAEFVCRRKLGSIDDPAALLTATDADAVAYGSGSVIKRLTKEEAAEAQRASMVEYLSMKHRILKVTASAVAIGTLSEAIIWNPGFASLFALGGVGSLGYQYLIQQNVDAIGIHETDQKTNLPKILSGPLSRLGLSLALGVAVYFLIQVLDQRTSVDISNLHRTHQLLNFAAGLLTFKLSIAYIALTSTKP